LSFRNLITGLKANSRGQRIRLNANHPQPLSFFSPVRRCVTILVNSLKRFGLSHVSGRRKLFFVAAHAKPTYLRPVIK
jgi:hypothetical protein